MKANQETLSQLSAEQLNEIETLYESGNPLKQRVASGLYNRSFVKTFNTFKFDSFENGWGVARSFSMLSKKLEWIQRLQVVDYRYIR